jgi:hypothetical protein
MATWEWNGVQRVGGRGSSKVLERYSGMYESV